MNVHSRSLLCLEGNTLKVREEIKTQKISKKIENQVNQTAIHAFRKIGESNIESPERINKILSSMKSTKLGFSWISSVISFFSKLKAFFKNELFFPTPNNIQELLEQKGLYNLRKQQLLAQIQDSPLTDLSKIDSSFHDDDEIVLAAIKKNGKALENALPKYKKDTNFVSAAIVSDESNLKFADEVVRSNESFMTPLIKKNGSLLEFAGNVLKNNEKIVLNAVKQNGLALQFASYHLRNDLYVVSQACENNENAIVFAGVMYHINLMFDL